MLVRDWLYLPIVRHIGIAVALLGTALLIQENSIDFSNSVFSTALDDLIPYERGEICRLSERVAEKGTAVGTSPEASPLDLVKPLLPGLASYSAPDPQRQRIALQALKAQRLECLHKSLLHMYVRNYYGSVVTSMAFGGIAAIALFLVGPKGWSASNPYLVNVMLASAAIAAFFGAFPGVFQQPAMVAAHKAQIMRYEALLDGMASHTAMPNVVPSACTSECTRARGRVCEAAFPTADFIACTDTALSIADIPFGLDPKSQPDYQRALGPSGAR